MKPKSQADFNVGDRVRLIADTLAWRAEKALQNKPGEVVERRDDGRVSIRYDGGRLLLGRDPKDFEAVSPARVQQ
jgi:hypothetical protein